VDDGKLVWHERMRAGMNSCPAVVGDLVLFGAGIKLDKGATPEIVALGLP